MAQNFEHIFLGWDQPALPTTAGHLIEHYIEGDVADLRSSTIVLPGRRALRRIIELLLEESEIRGVRLIPPKVITIGNLPELLYSNTKPLVDDITSRRAWSKALRNANRKTLEKVFPYLPDSITKWDELADLLVELHRDLARGGYRFADVVKACQSSLPFDDSMRWEILAELQMYYLDSLKQAGIADPFEARISALKSDFLSFTGDIWLVSIVEIPSVTKNLLEKSGAKIRTLIHAPRKLNDGADTTNAFDAFGLPSTDYWENALVPITNEDLEIVDKPDDQAESVRGILISFDGKYTADEITLAVNPESEVLPHLEQILKTDNVSSLYAAGISPLRTAPARLLQAIADYIDKHTFQALAALLRHPDVGALIKSEDIIGDEAIDIADKYFAEHLPFKVRDNILKGGNNTALFHSLLQSIEQESKISCFDGRKPLSEWMPIVMELLLEVYGGLELDQSQPAHLQLLDVLGRIQSVATSLRNIPETLDDECTGSSAIRILLLELNEDKITPDSRIDSVEILGWLEIPLDDAPIVIITGFNEGFLPKSVNGHAFLPDSLRTHLGLPDNRRRLAQDTYRLTTVMNSKKFVRLITGRRTTLGDPILPSRLMFRIREEDMPDRILKFYSEEPSSSRPTSSDIESSEDSQFNVPPEPEIELGEDEIPTALRVTDFKALISDPYRFVLERIYKLNNTDDSVRQLDPLDFGSLAHDILHRFGMLALDSSPKIDIWDESDVKKILINILDKEVSSRFGKDALPAIHIQAEQLKFRLQSFAKEQAEWASEGWQIIAVECEATGVPFDVDGTPILLGGRIDRIDHNPSTGEWALLDYKTGSSMSSPEKAHRVKLPNGLFVWKDLQLPLYRQLLSAIEDKHCRPIVNTKAIDKNNVRLGYISLPKKREDAGFELAEWNEEDLSSAEDFAQDIVRLLRRGKFDSKKTRISGSRDILDPILREGWKPTKEVSEQ